jgi:Holliday junction DNA helicase RuvB
MHRISQHMPRRDAMAEEWRRRQAERTSTGPSRARETEVTLEPLSFDARSANELRPATFDQMVAQDRLKALLRRIVLNCQRSGRPLDHMLLAGQSGTGKTTLAQVVAHESGATTYQVKAPVTHAVLAAAQRQLRDSDVLIVDEIHQQVTGDRRGLNQAADPEDFYHVMEDRRLPTETGMLPFPAITIIGCTTDEGLLPEAFLNRFPLRLTLDPYTPAEMALLAMANAHQLGVHIAADAGLIVGRASRRNPRQVNTFVRNAVALGYGSIDRAVAEEVIVELNGCTLDGLTPDMQGMLRCLLHSRRENRSGEMVYQASVNTIATQLGHSRDTKAVALFVEPYLLQEGYVQVGHGGRELTERGIARARRLVNG